MGVLGLWSAAIAAEMEYRANFVLATLTSLGNLQVACLGYFCSTALATPSKGGRGGSPCAGHLYRAAFSSTFLAPNSIVKHVQQADFVLLKPISSQFWLSSHTLSPWVWIWSLSADYAGGGLGLEIGDYLLSAVPFCLALSVSTACGLCWERPASGLSRYTTLPRF